MSRAPTERGAGSPNGPGSSESRAFGPDNNRVPLGALPSGAHIVVNFDRGS